MGPKWYFSIDRPNFFGRQIQMARVLITYAIAVQLDCVSLHLPLCFPWYKTVCKQVQSEEISVAILVLKCKSSPVLRHPVSVQKITSNILLLQHCLLRIVLQTVLYGRRQSSCTTIVQGIITLAIFICQPKEL